MDNFAKAMKKQFEETGDEKYSPERNIVQLDRIIKLHMVQSEYAREYILYNGISREKIVHLADYISQDYLEQEKIAESKIKENRVLYNPKKGKEFVFNLFAQNSVFSQDVRYKVLS